MPPEEDESVLFEVQRTSDRHAGHNYPPERPTEGAELNKEENRWELRMKTAKDFERLAYENDANLLLAFPGSGENDLPIIEIQDAPESGT